MRWLRIAAMMLLLLAILQSTVSAYSYTARIGLLAVTDHSGEVIAADVTISRGPGEFLMEPAQYIHSSVLYSTRVGYIISSLLNHIPPSSVYVRVYINTDTEVRGPSASGFLASTIFLGIRGIYPRNDTTMTGMISLAGFILPVAGIRYKVDAAAKAGYSRVILPYGEEPPSSPRIEIVHACSIEEAVEDLVYPKLPLVVTNVTLINRSISELVSNYINTSIFDKYTIFFIKAIKKLLQGYNGPRKDAYKSLLKLAEEALHKRHSYSAASIAFYTLVSLASSIASVKGFNYIEDKLNTSLEGELNKAHTLLTKASKSVFRNKLCDAWRVEALAAASARLYLAQNAAKNPAGNKVLALFRAISARSWIDLAEALHGPRVSCTLMKKSIESYVNYTVLSYKYMNSAIPFLAQELRMPDNRSVTSWLNDARRALSEGNYLLALGLAENTLASFEDVLVEYAELPPSCVTRHVFFLLRNSALGYILPTTLYMEYALTYARSVGKIIHDKYFASILGSDAATWALFGLFGWAVTNSTIPASSVAKTSYSTYTAPPSIEPIAIEALVLGSMVYAVALLVRRASSQKL